MSCRATIHPKTNTRSIHSYNSRPYQIVQFNRVVLAGSYNTNRQHGINRSSRTMENQVADCHVPPSSHRFRHGDRTCLEWSNTEQIRYMAGCGGMMVPIDVGDYWLTKSSA